MDELLLEVLGRNRLLGDLAQRHHRIFVVVALDRDLPAGGDHPRAMAREQDEIEPVLDLVDAVFDGDTGHSAAPGAGLSRWP
jgi:hypothetical protein